MRLNHSRIPPLARKSRMKNLAHGLSEPHMQRIAFEAWVPDHGVSYRRYLFRRFQTNEIMKLCHRGCDASRHRQGQVRCFQHANCREKVRKPDSQTALETSFSKRSIDEALLVGRRFRRDMTKA